MLFASLKDFYEKACACKSLDREEERACAKRMKAGDPEARERLIRAYLPHVAAHIRRQGSLQSLQMVYACLDALEAGVDEFNFLQESEPFSHHLAWRLRQASVKVIAGRP